MQINILRNALRSCSGKLIFANVYSFAFSDGEWAFNSVNKRRRDSVVLFPVSSCFYFAMNIIKAVGDILIQDFPIRDFSYHKS